MNRSTKSDMKHGSNPAITPKAYWDGWWKSPRSERPFGHWSLDPVIYGFDRFLAQHEPLQPDPRKTLLEIGCGGSNWLSYFAQKWDLHVEGIDYSEEGCRLAQEILTRDKVTGSIHLVDLFRPPGPLIGKFDMVISVGVLEHFADIGLCLNAFRAYLKPSGRMITLVPNLCGLMGRLLRSVAPENYSIHVPISKEGLAAAFQSVNMEILYCDYFLPFNLGLIDLTTIRSYLLQKIIGDFGNLLSRGICWFSHAIRQPLTSRSFSPYLLAVTENPSVPSRQGIYLREE